MPSSKNKAWFRELRDEVIRAMYEMESPIRHISHCVELKPYQVMSSLKRMKMKLRKCDRHKSKS